MPERTKRCTPEFRGEAVGFAHTGGRSCRETAADLDFGPSTLRAWIDGLRDAQMEPPPDRQENLVAESKRPRRGTGLLRQKREILKWATTTLAKEGTR